MGNTTSVLLTMLSTSSSSAGDCGMRGKLTPEPKRQRLDLDDVFCFLVAADITLHVIRI